MHVEVTGMPCIYDGQQSVQVIVRDVPSASAPNGRFRRQREILKKFFNRLPLFVGFLGVNGRIKMVNPRWKKELLWERGLNVAEFFGAAT